MRKIGLLVLLAVLAAAALGLSVASATTDCSTGLACVSVDEGGYVLVVDGDAANPDPADGFASVSDAPQVCADDNGTADDGDPDNGPESESPTCAP